MTDKQIEAIQKLKRIDIKYFLSGMMEQSNYIVEKAEEVNNAIGIVLKLLEKQQKEIEQLNEKKKNYTKKRKNYIKLYKLLEKHIKEKQQKLEEKNTKILHLEKVLNDKNKLLKESIYKGKIKGKIEKLKDKEQEFTDDQGYWGDSSIQHKIEILEELLGDE